MDHTLPSSDDESEDLARINQSIAQLGANAAKRRQKAADNGNMSSCSRSSEGSQLSSSDEESSDKENNNNGNITAKGVRGNRRNARLDSNSGKNLSLLLNDNDGDDDDDFMDDAADALIKEPLASSNTAATTVPIDEVVVTSINTDLSVPLPQASIYDWIRTVCREELNVEKPTQEQIEAIRILISKPEPSLKLILRTGAGKSLVRDCVALLRGGITINVVPLITLGSDQTQKIKEMTNVIHAIHADEIKGDLLTLLEQNFLRFGNISGKRGALVLIVSPQANYKNNNKNNNTHRNRVYSGERHFCRVNRMS
jgi:hypothetical protein